MFSCTACLKRAIQTVAGDYSYPSFQPTPFAFYLVGPSAPAASSRSHSTWASIQRGHHRRDLREGLSKPEQIESRKPRSKPSPTALRDIQARDRNRSLLSPTSTNHDTILVPSRGTRIELEFLRDPLKLAQTVLEKLRSNNALGALELVRASEKVPGGMTGSSGNLVSWNHLIDWYGHNDDMAGAAKMYNEMKKRGHRPDAHTYTIMLRGYANMARRRPQAAVKEAVGVFNSMFAKNSDVTPNSIHTNAVINVCARAGDLDSMWQILARIPEKGVGCPDNTTYTTVFNAMQADAMSKASQVARSDGTRSADQAEDEEDSGSRRVNVEKIFAQAAQDGRKLWIDVLQKWRSGQIAMDEPLACAMGRLLMLSMKESDWTEVLLVLQQTMDMPDLRKAEHKPKEARMPAHSREIGERTDLNEMNPSTVMATVDGPTADPETMADLTLSRGQTRTLGGSVTSSYAAPGNNTLSLLIEVSSLLKRPAMGKAYWDLLTSTSGLYKVAPDAQNLAAYLRLLRISRASRMARNLVQAEYPRPVAEVFFQRGTFVIAMSTCVRDKLNPNVFEDASGILDAMQGKLLDGDMEPKVLAMYIELALSTTPGVLSAREALERGRTRDKFVPDLRRNNIMRALRRLGPDVINIRKLIKDKADEGVDNSQFRVDVASRKKRRTWVDMKGGDAGARMEDLVNVLRALTGACDRIIGVNQREHGVEFAGSMREAEWNEYVKNIADQKKKLSGFLARMINPTSAPHYRNEVPEREFAPQRKAKQDGNVAQAEAGTTEADDKGSVVAHEELAYDPEEAELDNEIFKSIVAHRKVHRAIKEGKSAYEKTQPKQTLKYQRARNAEKREERRIEGVRSMFPPDRLKPMNPQKGRQDRWADKQRLRKQKEEAQRLGGVSGMVQRGWGAGFEGVAKAYCDGTKSTGTGIKRSDFVEL